MYSPGKNHDEKQFPRIPDQINFIYYIYSDIICTKAMIKENVRYNYNDKYDL